MRNRVYEERLVVRSKINNPVINETPQVKANIQPKQKVEISVKPEK